MAAKRTSKTRQTPPRSIHAWLEDLKKKRRKHPEKRSTTVCDRTLKKEKRIGKPGDRGPVTRTANPGRRRVTTGEEKKLEQRTKKRTVLKKRGTRDRSSGAEAEARPSRVQRTFQVKLGGRRKTRIKTRKGKKKGEEGGGKLEIRGKPQCAGRKSLQNFLRGDF